MFRDQTGNERENMNRRDFVVLTVACAVRLSTASRGVGQQKVMEPDLAKLADGKGLELFNRSTTSFNEAGKNGIRLSENAGEGIAYIQGIDFANGTIEFDVKGNDVKKQGFAGFGFPG